MTAPTDHPHRLRPQRSLDLPDLRRALEGWLQQGWLPVTLGNRVLRSETAPLAALAYLMLRG